MKIDYYIILTKDILNDDVKLCQSVKKIMEVIINLFKDRVKIDDSPISKKIRTKKFRKTISLEYN